jgi:hypothetical protein
MAISKKTGWAIGIAAVVAIAAIVLYPRLVVGLPNDGADAKPFTFKGVRGQRYTEMFLIGGNAITKDLKANVYNTWGLNGGATTGDSCPAALLDKVDVKELKDRYHVLAAFKNGPRLWTLDWIEVEMGKELDFGGMKARWVNWLDMKGISTEPGAADYKNITVGRHTKFGFDKGKQVFILDDPAGNPWVMQAYSLIVDSNLTYELLKDLGSKLKLPEGWKFRTKVLDEDLTIKAVDGIAHIVQDDLENTYDLCADGSCNFNP